MPYRLLSSVKIIEALELDGAALATIARYATGIGDRSLRLAVVRDEYSMPIRTQLVEALKTNSEVIELTRVQPNPRSSDIDAMLNETRLTECDAIIGIGGGSVLDSAKALAMLASNGGTLNDYLGPAPARKIEKKGLPLILIPTTAGTGSEVTKVGVYTSDSGRKYTLGSPLLLAQVAVLCGAITSSMPPALTAAVGFDALDHAFESIWNKNATPITRSVAIEAAVDVLKILDDAYDASLRLHAPLEGDIDIRQKMLLASCKAGVAFNMTGTAAGHALSFILSEEWHVPHGAACAFTLVDIYRHALCDPASTQALATIAKAFFPQVADPMQRCELLLDKIITMKKRMHMSETFADLGISIAKEDIPCYFERAFSDPKMLNQVPVATNMAIYPMLEKKIC
jgi:alcohol dehydrogenase class IV